MKNNNALYDEKLKFTIVRNYCTKYTVHSQESTIYISSERRSLQINTWKLNKPNVTQQTFAHN